MSVTIDGYPVDIALSLDYSRKSDISSYPVERGTNFSDNSRVNEPELTFEGLVSDTPIGAIADHPTRAGVSSAGSSAFQRLDAMQVAGVPLTVECSLGVFDMMEISSLKVKRDSKTRKGLQFTVTFSRIRIVDNAKTTIAVATGEAPFNDFGTSLAKLKNGDKILWRKGKPPGSSNIVGKEILQVVDTDFNRSQIRHLDGRPLGTTGSPGQMAEQDAFFLDLERDAKLSKQQKFGKELDKRLAQDEKASKTLRNWVQAHPNRDPPGHSPLTGTLGNGGLSSFSP